MEINKFILFSTMCSEECHWNVAFPADYLTGIESQRTITFFAKDALKNNEGS